MFPSTSRMPRTYRNEWLRNKLIAEWRASPDDVTRNRPVKDLSSVLGDVLKSWKLDENLQAEEVTAVWKEITGEFVGKNSAPDKLKRGVLTVRVSQPAIHHTLTMKKKDILTRLQDRFGKTVIKDVKFRIG